MGTSPPPSILLRRGRIYTLDPERPVVEALAIAGGRIVAVGTDEAISPLAGPATEIVDLGGRTVLPGLTDAHLHFEQYALHLSHLVCETPTKHECLERVRRQAQAAPPGGWILGHGWNQNTWGSYGCAADLDAAAPNHPVYLTAKSLHAAWANTASLRIAGIRSTTPDPPGGVIQRDAGGAPTGILLEAAVRLVSAVIPAPSLGQLAGLLRAAQEQLWRFGLTGVHDFDGQRCHEALQILQGDDGLGLRVVKHVQLEALEPALALGLRTGMGDDWIRIGSVKVFADGALGPRTAAMLDPYEGEPENRGLLLRDRSDLFDTARKAVESGLAMAIHAIGDRANRAALDAYEDLRRHEEERNLPRLRHRIEHMQILHPEDIARPGRLGIVASMQPIHATSDRSMADRYWGERVRHAYAWRSLMQAGTVLAFGSDAPVESPNPFPALHAAVTRRGPDGNPGPDGWVPEERLSLAQALTAFTHGPAFAASVESVLGRLAAGFLADLIVLDDDPFACPPEALAALQPVGAMVDGLWRHRTF